MCNPRSIDDIFPNETNTDFDYEPDMDNPEYIIDAYQDDNCGDETDSSQNSPGYSIITREDLEHSASMSENTGMYIWRRSNMSHDRSHECEFPSSTEHRCIEGYDFQKMYSDQQYDLIIKIGDDERSRKLFSKSDYIYYGRSLYKEQQYENFLAVYKEFYKKYPDSNDLDPNLSWALYRERIKKFDNTSMSVDRLLKIVDFALKHCDDSKYSAKYVILDFITDAIYKKKLSDNPNYTLGNKYLTMYEPSNLSSEETHYTLESGKIIIAHSNKEKWYERKTKTLLEIGKYEECIKYSNEALNTITKFHNNSNYWFQYRKARCKYCLSQYEDAKSLLEKIISGFKHWCFYGLMFNIAVKQSAQQEALKYAALASCVDDAHELRVNLYKDIAVYLFSINENKLAELYARFVTLIRDRKGWRRDETLIRYEISENTLRMNEKRVISELTEFWMRERDEGKTFLHGRITHLLPEGRSGFISDTSGQSYYFNMRDVIGNDSIDQIGVPVKFTLIEKLDRKYGVMKLNAIEISRE